MKKILVFLLIFTVAFSAMSLSAFATGEEAGISFATEWIYKTNKPIIDCIPRTFEATIKIDENHTSSEHAGVIIGTYGEGNGCFNFEISENGVPRIYARNNNEDAPVFEYKFTKVNVPKGEWVTIGVALTSGKKGYCYINGELKQTISWTSTEVSAGTVDKTTVLHSTAAYPYSVNVGTSMVVGGDKRGGNSKYFKGKIKDVKIYKSAASDANLAAGTGTTPTSAPLASYNLALNSNGTLPAKIEDLSGNGYDFYYNDRWIEEEPALEDYAYSFAVIGDTQIVNRDNPEYFTGIYDWILENSDKYNTKFVFGLGDITDSYKEAADEWARAKTEIDRLDGYLPYSLVRGNHDTIELFNQTFPYSEYGDQVSGSFDGTMLSTYQKFNIGNVKYMVVNLDLGATDEVLAWANEIVEANPDRNVIVTTHGYLYRDGTTLTGNDPMIPSKYTKNGNDGEGMWNEFIKLHENIVLVMGGHISSDTVITSQATGDNGNTVTQMLVNPQGLDGKESGTGMVAMLHFSEDGEDVQLRYYSTVKEAYFLTENQRSFTLDLIEPVVEVPKISVSGISFDVKLTGAEIGEGNKIIAALYDGEYNLSECIVYDAAEEVKVTFTKAAANPKVKVMWWDGIDTLLPIALPETVSIQK